MKPYNHNSPKLPLAHSLVVPEFLIIGTHFREFASMITDKSLTVMELFNFPSPRSIFFHENLWLKEMTQGKVVTPLRLLSHFPSAGN